MHYLLLFFFLTATLFSNNHTVKIGVLAKRGVEQTFNRWNPTAEYLTKVVKNKKFEIVPISFNSLFNYIKDKKVDFILTNSGFYVELEYKYGVQRITTLINKHLSGLSQKEFGGVIFSHADNAKRFLNIDDIRGTNFIAVNEKSLGGWQMAWRELAENGIDREDDLASLNFKETHDAVVYSILNKEADIGTVRSDTLERMAMEGKIDINKIHVINSKEYDNFPFLTSTRLYPEWPFAKLKHTSDSLSKEVVIALMQMKSSSDAAIKANITGWQTPLSYQSVHACFKFLKISPYYQEIKILDVIEKYIYWIIFYFLLASIAIGMLVYQIRLTRHLKHAQKELVQTEKMASMGRLVAGVSHEVNTPVGIAVTAASHLRNEVENFENEYTTGELTQSTFESFIQTSIKSSDYILINLERAAKLIQNFKNISVDQSSNEIREFYVKEYLDEIIISLHPKIKKTSHKITVKCDDRLRINSNPGVFYQIFSNLIFNSLIHGFDDMENGHIVIEVDSSYKYLYIKYRDDGKGVSAEGLKKIFDPFYTTKRTSGGSGLGTHIIYNLVTQKLDGNITVDSIKNKGLVYTMIFKGIKYV